MKKFLKKLKNFIIKNKLLSVLIFLFILILLLGLIALKVIIFPSYRVSKYGNRLENIESVKLDASRFSDVKNKFENVDGLTVGDFRVSGRIINVFVTASDSLDINVLKSSCDKLIKGFSEDELNYYDFQVFVEGDGDSYPLIGYKNKNSEGLHWSYEGEI